MARLDKLIELNKPQKLNRRNRLEDKLKQHEYYGELEELFDPLTKTLNTNSEILQAHQTQTMEASGERAAQIGETGLRIEDNTNPLKALEFSPVQQSEFSVREPVTLPGREGKLFKLSNEMLDILADMRKQKNIQLRLVPFDANESQFTINNVPTHITPNGIKLRNNNYDFTKGFLMFITNKNVTERDIEGHENKIKQFPSDIGYKKGGETKSNRSKVIKRLSVSIASPRRDSFSKESTVDDTNEEEEEEVKASGLTETDPNNLVERLQLLILETKARHDGLYDEMLDKSKQQLSMNIINQEQLDNFDFNYGKKLNNNGKTTTTIIS